jgi:hypothetical protein
MNAISLAVKDDLGSSNNCHTIGCIRLNKDKLFE